MDNELGVIKMIKSKGRNAVVQSYLYEGDKYFWLEYLRRKWQHPKGGGYGGLCNIHHIDTINNELTLGWMISTERKRDALRDKVIAFETEPEVLDLELMKSEMAKPVRYYGNSYERAMAQLRELEAKAVELESGEKLMKQDELKPGMRVEARCGDKILKGVIKSGRRNRLELLADGEINSDELRYFKKTGKFQASRNGWLSDGKNPVVIEKIIKGEGE